MGFVVWIMLSLLLAAQKKSVEYKVNNLAWKKSCNIFDFCHWFRKMPWKITVESVLKTKNREKFAQPPILKQRSFIIFIGVLLWANVGWSPHDLNFSMIVHFFGYIENWKNYKPLFVVIDSVFCNEFRMFDRVTAKPTTAPRAIIPSDTESPKKLISAWKKVLGSFS